MPTYSKRCVLNMNSVNGHDFGWINLCKMGDFGFLTVDRSLLDVNGYATVNGVVGGFSMKLPSASETAGPYVLTWTGTGTLSMDSVTWTDVSLGPGTTRLSNGRWSGTNGRVVSNISDWVQPVAPGNTFGLTILTTDPSATGDYVRDVKLFFLADETDLLAGKVFRRGWKDTILDFNPSAIRMLNWDGGSSSQISWFTDRTPVENVSYNRQWNGVTYPSSSGTNAIVVGSAAGMPVAMTHGEVATFKVTNAVVGDGVKFISSITKANPGVVTTTAAHNFTNGDLVVLMVNDGLAGSMHQMHYKVVTVAGATSTTFQCSGLNTSAFDTYTTGGVVMRHTTLNVGARGTYPVLFEQGTAPVTYFATYGTYIGANSYRTFTFDKYLIGDRDVGPGAWLVSTGVSNDGQPLVLIGGVPFEKMVALVNELNDEKVGGEPINMWVTMPHKGMQTVDPDYTSGRDWAKNAVNLILNGGGGYPGLDASATLFVEYSNETWNSAGGFYSSQYLGRLGQIRYGGGVTPFSGGSGGYSTQATVKSIVMCQDLATAYPSEIASGRLVRVGAGQGAYQWAPADGSPNDIRINGDALVLADAWNVGGTAPYTKFEAFAWASYFESAQSYFDDGDLADKAAEWTAAVGAAAKEAVIADYVTNVIRVNPESGTGVFGDTILPNFANRLTALGKVSVCYEGGYNWPTVGWPTTELNNFMVAVQRSQAWADEQVIFLNKVAACTGAYMPAIFIQTGGQWAYIAPNSTNWSGGVEGAALNQTWAAIGEYNDSVDGTEPEPPPAGTAVIARPRVRMR